MMTFPFLARLRKTAGFSLVEIIVAVGLLAVIIVGLLAMFYQTQRAFRAGMAQVDVHEGARAALELISRELQEICPSIETSITNMEWGVTMPLPLELPGGQTFYSSIQTNLWFLRKVNDEWTAESYQVSNAVAGVGTLYRLSAIGGHTNVARMAEYVRTNLIQTSAGSSNFMRVTDGVVHFRVLPFDSKGLLIVSNVIGSINAIPEPSPTYYSFYSNSSNSIPPYLDVELAVLEPKALEQFRARPSPANLAYLKKQPGRMHFFKQRVALRNAPQYFSITNVP